MITSLQTIHNDSPIRSLLRYAESRAKQAEDMIRAQVRTEKQTTKPKPMTDKQSRDAIIFEAKQRVNLVDICAKVNRTRAFVRKVLAMEGIDFRHLAKPFKGQESGTKEKGIEFRVLLKRGIEYGKAAEMLGMKERVASESLALAGGMKGNQ